MTDFEPYLRAWRERWKRQRAEDEAAAGKAMSLARRLSTVLVERYGARRVFLCGSLARGEFGEGSDIDLAAEGIADEGFFRAGAELERLAEPLRVDLVPLESATPAYRRDLERDGIALHGRA